MAIRVNVPQRQGGRGLQINPIQARGQVLQASAPAPPKQDWSAVGKSMMGLADQIKESRQKANRAKLVQSLVQEDDMGEGEAFNATVPQVQVDGMEGMMQDSGVMGGPSAPAMPKASRLSQLNMPDQAKSIFKEMVKSGDTDGAYKIAMKFALQPPKSTGREYFNINWLEKTASAHGLQLDAAQDIQATLTELTATTVIESLKAWGGGIKTLVVCGGGRLNDDLMHRIRQAAVRLTPIPSLIEPSEYWGVDGDAIEAATFAWLAHRRLQHLPGNVPAVTGAAGERVLGAIY